MEFAMALQEIRGSKYVRAIRAHQAGLRSMRGVLAYSVLQRSLAIGSSPSIRISF